MNCCARVHMSMLCSQWYSFDPNLLSPILAQMLLSINIYFPTVSSDSVFFVLEGNRGRFDCEVSALKRLDILLTLHNLEGKGCASRKGKSCTHRAHKREAMVTRKD